MVFRRLFHIKHKILGNVIINPSASTQGPVTTYSNPINVQAPVTTYSNPTNPFAPANKGQLVDKSVSLVSNANVNPLAMAPGAQLSRPVSQLGSSPGIKNKKIY